MTHFPRAKAAVLLALAGQARLDRQSWGLVPKPQISNGVENGSPLSAMRAACPPGEGSGCKPL